jgi:hypothetical protein
MEGVREEAMEEAQVVVMGEVVTAEGTAEGMEEVTVAVKEVV